MENKIKEVLKKKGVTQKELCARIGMTEAGLSKAINGSASKVTLEKVAAALCVKYEDLTNDGSILYAKYSAEKTPLM